MLLIACQLEARDYERAALRARKGWKLRNAPTIGQALVDIEAAGMSESILVCELGVWTTPDLLRVIEAYRRIALLPRLMLRCSLSQRAAQQLLETAASSSDSLISIRELDDCEEGLSLLSHGFTKASPLPLVLSRLCAGIPPDVTNIVVGALILGGRCMTVQHLAKACALSRRTVELRLARARYLSAAELLAWGRLLHAMWQIEVLGRTTKQAAAEVGFSSGRALCSLVKRHTALAIGDLRRSEGFALLLERFASDVDSRERKQSALRRPLSPA
jgi:AraC-like DNA-binding protein